MGESALTGLEDIQNRTIGEKGVADRGNADEESGDGGAHDCLPTGQSGRHNSHSLDEGGADSAQDRDRHGPQQIGHIERARGQSGDCREGTAMPVHCPSPVKIKAESPAEATHGSRTSSTCEPARPTTSSMRTAATSGLPKTVAIAAADPATASKVKPCGEERSFDRPSASRTSPLPSAVSGDSGPSTTPRASPPSAARTTAGRKAAGVVPPPSPFTGRCPPRPGKLMITSPTNKPAMTSTSTAYQSVGSLPAELLRQGLPDQVLKFGHGRKEEECDHPNRQADEGRDE